jgi:hypothetical protein
MTESQAALKRLGDNVKAIKTELAGKLGEHTFGLLADGRCLSFKFQHRKGYTVEPGGSRVLRVLKHQPEAHDDDTDD